MAEQSAYRAMQDGLKRMKRVESSIETGTEPYDWPMSRSTPEEYAHSFFPAIGRSLQKHFTERRAQELTNVCLDLASDGWVFTDLSVPHDGALAVGISDPSLIDDNHVRYEMGDVSVIAGNLVKQTTWNDIDEWLKQRDASGFDQVFFRPGGGMPFIGVNSEHHAHMLHPLDMSTHEGLLLGLLHRVLERLSPEGEVFAELSYGTESEAHTMEHRLNTALNTPGIVAKVHLNSLSNIVVHIHKIH